MVFWINYYPFAFYLVGCAYYYHKKNNWKVMVGCIILAFLHIWAMMNNRYCLLQWIFREIRIPFFLHFVDVRLLVYLYLLHKTYRYMKRCRAWDTMPKTEFHLKAKIYDFSLCVCLSCHNCKFRTKDTTMNRTN